MPLSTCFGAESLASAHHCFRSVDFASTVSSALALDEICRHGGYRNEQLCSMPGEGASPGGGPTIEVRIDVHLCVAATGKCLPQLDQAKPAVRTVLAP